MGGRRGLAAGLLAVALVAAGCSSSDDDGGRAAKRSGTTTTTAPLPKASAAPVDAATLGVDPSTEERCDPLGARCLLPYPNDHFTVADRSTPTQRRLAVARESAPANASGTHIDVSDQDRGDGWSPGSTLLVEIPGLDPTASKLPALTDPSTSLAADAPIVLLDATTHRRHPYWAELDAQADPGEAPLLMVHPARNFPDGHRIVVGLRHLRTTDGTAVAATPAFAAYRDGQRTTDDAFEARRPAMEHTFADLAAAGVRRSDLVLAWDFTVASTESLTGRMVAMRDDAFAQLGDAAPTFHVDTVTDDPEPMVRRRIEGTFELPVYLTDGGKPGSRLVLDDSGLPVRQSGTFTAKFLCDLPPASTTKPARSSLYGHGLLGDLGEVKGDLTKKMSADHDIAYCATNWYGMAEEDIATAIGALGDLSNFAQLPDRLQQGFLAFLFLGRLLTHPKGFVSDPAFRFDGHPAIDTGELYFDGNSQGAILGGALTAVAQDWTRSALGEAGMNYSLLLDRSVDFDDYLLVMKPAYPARYDRVMGLALAQLLWDRGETDGYANHVTSHPLGRTPRHDVLLYGAVGDHQVTEYSLRVEAATMGVPAHEPIAKPGRVAEKDPGWLLDAIGSSPHRGSAYFLWDTGSPSSPVQNLPSRQGHDPHDDTPSIPGAQTVKDAFWHDHGAVPDPCGGKACTAPVPPENA